MKTVSIRKEIQKTISQEQLLSLCKDFTQQIKDFCKKKKIKKGTFEYRVEYDNPIKKLRPTLIIERIFEVKDVLSTKE